MITKLRRFFRWTLEYDPYTYEEPDFACRCGRTFDERDALDEHLAEAQDLDAATVEHALED